MTDVFDFINPSGRNGNTPERIYNWMDSQLSIARFYGGITYNGVHYTVSMEKDSPLVRDDVLKREADERKAKAKADHKAAKAKQAGLDL